MAGLDSTGKINQASRQKGGKCFSHTYEIPGQNIKKRIKTCVIYYFNPFIIISAIFARYVSYEKLISFIQSVMTTPMVKKSVTTRFGGIEK